jgi:putative DNA methylase
VAVLINKAMIEIPPRFAGRPPVNPEARENKDLFAREWKGAQGLAEDVRYYGRWMRDEAEKRIGYLYPKVEVTAETAKRRPDLRPYVGRTLTVVAWLWARTVKSPNPAFASVDVPLISTFMLSTKAGGEVYVEPIVEGSSYRFAVHVGKPKNPDVVKRGTKLARANFACVMSGTPVSGDYIKAEGKAGRIGARLMAMVVEGDRKRLYLAPLPDHEAVAQSASPEWRPEVVISGSTQYLGVKPYGMDRFDQLFTNRQLVALATFAQLVDEAKARIRLDAVDAGLVDSTSPLRDAGNGAQAYSEAVPMYLAFALSKLADRGSTICTWFTERDSTRNTFGRQAIPMTWDFAELNTLLGGTGSFLGAAEWTAESLEGLAVGGAGLHSSANQADAQRQDISAGKVVSTDPPYYDNVPYADLADFFYVWLRRTLRPIFPDLFATVAAPKAEELVAFAHRHFDGKVGAERFFLEGMTEAMHRLAEVAHQAFPVTIYYAFKQSESDDDAGTASTGWETFLDAVIRAGFATSGTWPMRTELGNRMRGMDSNALASSIVIACRPRTANAPTATRRQFVAALKAELPVSLAHLQRSNIAPVDLAQAAIGPGMAVFTRYTRVLGANDKPLTVREALALINQTLDEALAEQEGDFDADSRWAITWFDENGFAEGEYGRAEQLSKSKNTSVDGMKDAGIVASSRGKVRLLKPEELDADWDPTTDVRLSAWETVHQLVRALSTGGDAAAAALVAKLGGARADAARELAYRLYTLCERKKRAAEALAYNALVQSWPEIVRLAADLPNAAAGAAAATEDLF